MMEKQTNLFFCFFLQFRSYILFPYVLLICNYLMTAVHISLDLLEQYTFPVCTSIKVLVTAVSDTGGNMSLTITIIVVGRTKS